MPVIAGAIGTAGAAVIVALVDAGELPHALVAVTVYIPANTFKKVPEELLKTIDPPEIRLYVNPAMGELIFTDDCKVQVG